MLYDFGKVSSAVEASQAGVTERRAEARLSVEQVVMNTALAFLDGQYYQRLIAITQDQIDNLEKISSLARQRLDKGASTRSDYVQTMSRIEAAKVTGFQYQANLARTFATLSNLTGQSRVDGVSDHFPRELEQSCQQVDTDMQDNPEVQSAQAQVIRAQAEVTAASAAGLPTLSLEPTFTRQLDGSTGVDQDRSRYSVFLNASMPIYQGARSRPARRPASGPWRPPRPGSIPPGCGHARTCSRRKARCCNCMPVLAPRPCVSARSTKPGCCTASNTLN